MLCASIINFVIENEKTILEKPEILNGLTISDIGYQMAGYTKYGNNDINNYAGYLYEYIRYRKDHFYGDARQGIINGDEDTFKSRKRIVWSKATNDDIELSKTRVNKRGNDSDLGIGGRIQDMARGFNPHYIDGGQDVNINQEQLRDMLAEEPLPPMPEVVAHDVIWRR